MGTPERHLTVSPSKNTRNCVSIKATCLVREGFKYFNPFKTQYSNFN